MTIHKIFMTALLLSLLVSCRNEPKQETHVSEVQSSVIKDTIADDKDGKSNTSMLTPREKKLEGFTFRYGYTAYDEEKYSLSNPGYLEVLKGNKVVFKDKFEGNDEPYITSLGYHNLDGNKLVFRLNYGTEACDYVQTSCYYVMNEDGSFRYINNYSSFTGGDHYASQHFSHIFPNDSLGKPNTLTIVEGITYHNHDKPDVADTTHITFKGNSFTIKKLTDNLSKAE